MSQDEIAVMDGGKCIMQFRGVRPFFSDKFDITKHKCYKELPDYDPKSAFDCGEVTGQEENSSQTTEYGTVNLRA